MRPQQQHAAAAGAAALTSITAAPRIGSQDGRKTCRPVTQHKIPTGRLTYPDVKAALSFDTCTKSGAQRRELAAGVLTKVGRPPEIKPIKI